MLLILSSLLSIAMAAFVVVAGEDRRSKVWFVLLCTSTAALSAGLWVEVNVPTWAPVAARVNMTSGLMLASTGMLSARAMCRLRVNWTAIALIAFALVVDIASVWATKLYFTGRLITYRWGTYVESNVLFLITPFLMTVVAFYGILTLWNNYRSAHPLEKNRTKYLFLAYLFLFIAALDFLPHFHVDLFGGPLSGVAIPLFLATYSYAMLRYRLFEFRGFVGRTAGWFLATVLMVIVYALTVEGGKRLGVAPRETYVAASIAAFLAWLGVGRHLPVWAQKFLSQERDLSHRVQIFDDEIVSLLDEHLLTLRLRSLCVGEFGAADAEFVESDRAKLYSMSVDPSSDEILEKEIAMRLGDGWPDDLAVFDVALPLVRNRQLFGLVMLGARTDGKMYTRDMLVALRHAANIFSVTLSNIRSAREIEKRHQLDRYLAPQIVDRVLAGQLDSIATMRRVLITVFFSDLKDFTPIADTMNPETLASVLNHYLSEMAEIAFSYGGTVDKFIGDAVMVIFGAPLDSDQGVQVKQCVQMALAMHARTRVLNQEWITAGSLGSGLVSRMGIHTGEATVGSFGSDNRVDYTAIGRSVNLASRLEKQCTPGRVLVSADCWKYLSNAFRGEFRGSIHAKGFAEPIDAYELDADAAPSVETSGAR